MKDIYGLGRSRSNEGKGEWTNVHLNPYTNCIHTLCGGVWDKDYSPSITISSFQHNNIVMENMEKEDFDRLTREQQKLMLPPELQGKKFRIRKLTERECLRLMDVDDKDIDKIQATGLSKSAQYKLAGNSIVVSVLYHIFRKMFIETDNENQQLSLF